MDKYDIISLRSQPRWRMPAARWFAARWGIPLEEYLASIDECIRGAAPVPQWYIVTGVEPGRIVAGAGVITNDFHDRKDLAPNVCALYVEPELRRCGIAGLLLEHICEDMAARGVGTLYLITEHTSFYERYGWGHLCMARGDDGEQMRVYIKAAGREVRRACAWHGAGPVCSERDHERRPRRQRAHPLPAAPARRRCQVVVHEKFHPIMPPAAREAACATPWCSTRGSRPLSWWPPAMWQGRAKACGACSAARQ